MNGSSGSDLRNPHPFPLMLSPPRLNNKRRPRLSCCHSPLPARAGSVGGRRRAGSCLEPMKLLQKVRGEIKCTREIKAQSHFHILPIPLPKKGQCRIDHIKSHYQTHPLPHFLYVGILVLVNIWGPVVVTTQRR